MREVESYATHETFAPTSEPNSEPTYKEDESMGDAVGEEVREEDKMMMQLTDALPFLLRLRLYYNSRGCAHLALP